MKYKKQTNKVTLKQGNYQLEKDKTCSNVNNKTSLRALGRKRKRNQTMLHDHYTAFYGQTSKIPQLAPHPHPHREKKRSIMNQIPVCNTFVLFEPWQSTYLSLRDESGRLGLVVQPRCWPWVLGRNSCMVDRRGHCPHERPVTGRLWSILQRSYRFSPKPIWAMPSPPPPSSLFLPDPSNPS